MKVDPNLLGRAELERLAKQSITTIQQHCRSDLLGVCHRYSAGMGATIRDRLLVAVAQEIELAPPANDLHRVSAFIGRHLERCHG